MGKRWKQVRLNKDASGERSEDKIAERDMPDLIADCLMQIVYRYVAGCLQVICSQETTSRLFQYFDAVSTQFPRSVKKRASNGRTEGGWRCMDASENVNTI